MKPIKTLLTALLLVSVIVANAQDYNPYKSIGKKAKILTAYGDKFVEVFDYDTIQRIGSVLFNIKTKKIVKLLPDAKIFKKYSNNSAASRWYSVDPLAEKYASLSPYAAMGNNPILFSDIDGRELIIKGDPKLQDEYARMLTKTTGRQVSINHESGVVSIGEALKNQEQTSTVLYKVLDDVVKSTYAYQVSLTGGSGDDNVVWIDSYTKAKIDIADLKTIEKGTDNAFLAGTLGHFLFEIFSTDKYSDKTESEREALYQNAHDQALLKEGEIVGTMLGIGTNAASHIPQKVSPNDKKQNVKYFYGKDGIVSYLLSQGITGVKKTGTQKVTIGGVEFEAPVYEVEGLTGILKNAQKVEDEN